MHALQGKKVTKSELLRQTLEIEHKILQENSGSQDQTTGRFNSSNLHWYTTLAEDNEKDKIAQLEENKSYYVTIHQTAMDAYSLLQSDNFSLNEFSDLLN